MARATLKRAAEVKTAAAEAVNTVETPTATVVKAANVAETVVDSQGRTIKVQKLGALQRLRMHEVLGALGSNEGYMAIAGVAFCVREIDGEAVPMPRTKNEIEALVQRLDEHGLAAASDAIQKMLGIAIDAEGNLTVDGVVVKAAKN